MNKYVIWVSENDVKRYIKITDNGGAEGVTDKQLASVMPNRAVASSICAALRPALKKQKMNVQIGFDVLCSDVI